MKLFSQARKSLKRQKRLRPIFMQGGYLRFSSRSLRHSVTALIFCLLQTSGAVSKSSPSLLSSFFTSIVIFLSLLEDQETKQTIPKKVPNNYRDEIIQSVDSPPPRKRSFLTFAIRFAMVFSDIGSSVF